MPSPNFDVLCLGNAIVDVICQVEDDILGREQIVKGSMTLIDESRAEHLYRLMPQVTVVSGGSAANTAVGVASFGARAAFVGKVKNDEVGFFFTRDLKAAGVHFETPHAVDGLATARLVYHGHARWAALDEHLPGRLSGPGVRRYRPGGREGRIDHLLRRLLVGPCSGQNGISESGGHRSCRRANRCHHAVG